jgi:hypothetical protein
MNTPRMISLENVGYEIVLEEANRGPFATRQYVVYLTRPGEAVTLVLNGPEYHRWISGEQVTGQMRRELPVDRNQLTLMVRGAQQAVDLGILSPTSPEPTESEIFSPPVQQRTYRSGGRSENVDTDEDFSPRRKIDI